MLTGTNQQARRLIVHAFVHGATAGLAEIGERQKAQDDFMPQVAEANVVRWPLGRRK
jgi:hypothetical protein